MREWIATKLSGTEQENHWNSIEPAGTQSNYLGATTMTMETLWRCDQLRAGRLYNRMIFDTREEAEQFMNRMREMEPDQTISVEAVDAYKVWN